MSVEEEGRDWHLYCILSCCRDRSRIRVRGWELRMRTSTSGRTWRHVSGSVEQPLQRDRKREVCMAIRVWYFKIEGMGLLDSCADTQHVQRAKHRQISAKHPVIPPNPALWGRRPNTDEEVYLEIHKDTTETHRKLTLPFPFRE